MKSAFVALVIVIASQEMVSASTNSGVLSVAAGSEFSCALLADHTVSCWGSGPAAPSFSPAPIDSIRGVASITAGRDFACAALQSGQVQCWGSNQFGQLGIGDNTVSVPVMRDTKHQLQLITAVAAGSLHACALQKVPGGPSGVYCWGSNQFDQLGNFTLGTSSRYATAVIVHDGVTNPALDQVDSITEGELFGCAQRTDETAVCWGLNSLGQLGNGSIQMSDTPTYVADANGHVQFNGQSIAAGGNHVCALSARPQPDIDAANCWGSNLNGELGNSFNAFTGTAVTTPLIVRFTNGLELNSIDSLASGGEFTCAVLSNLASVECWGANAMGQLGNRGTESSVQPMPAYFQRARSIKSLTAGAAHGCAIVDGNVECWGSNEFGQLGLGYTDDDPHPTPIIVDVDGPIFTDAFE